MKRLLPKLRTSLQSALGFTMIELLIVISILGILAVAVLSAINPIEQINRGRDTGSRSDAEQLLSAIDRYNAFQGYFPWTDGAGDGTVNVPWGRVATNNTDLNNTSGCNMLTSLSTTSGACTGTDELKSSFITRITSTTANPLFMYYSGTQGHSVYVCFAPKSKAFVTEAANRELAGTPTDYPASALNNTTDCGTGGDCVCLP